jgi:hypothetical protein
VKPARPALPEFEPHRNNSEASPKRRTGYVVAIESRADLRNAIFEFFPAGEPLALFRRPCAELARQGTASEIRFGFLACSPFGAPDDLYLAFQLGPKKMQGCNRINGQVAGFSAFVVRKENKPVLIETL